MPTTNPTFSLKEISQAAQSNFAATCYALTAFAKSHGIAPADCWTFIGRGFAASWEPGMPLAAVAQRAALNIATTGATVQSLAIAPPRAELVVTNWPDPARLAHFGLTPAEADTMFAIFEPIAAALGYGYQWQRLDDSIVIIITDRAA